MSSELRFLRNDYPFPFVRHTYGNADIHTLLVELLSRYSRNAT